MMRLRVDWQRVLETRVQSARMDAALGLGEYILEDGLVHLRGPLDCPSNRGRRAVSTCSSATARGAAYFCVDGRP